MTKTLIPNCCLRDHINQLDPIIVYSNKKKTFYIVFFDIMGVFSSCMSNNKKKNEIEKMKEIRDKARDKANELQMQ